jgi:hypothetical protein
MFFQWRSTANQSRIVEFKKIINEKYQDVIASAAVIPGDILFDSILDESCVSILISALKHVPLAALRDLSELLEDKDSPQRLYLYLFYQDFALALNRSDLRRHVFCLPSQWMDVGAALYLKTLGGHLFSGLNINKKEILGHFFTDEDVMTRVINDPRIFRLPPVKFQIFFWQAMQLKLSLNAGNSEKAHVSFTSWQVCRRWMNADKIDLSWLETFHNEYQKDLNGLPSDSEKFYSKAVTALKEIYVNSKAYPTAKK